MNKHPVVLKVGRIHLREIKHIQGSRTPIDEQPDLQHLHSGEWDRPAHPF